jgi:hypothetical protein
LTDFADSFHDEGDKMPTKKKMKYILQVFWSGFQAHRFRYGSMDYESENKIEVMKLTKSKTLNESNRRIPTGKL